MLLNQLLIFRHRVHHAADQLHGSVDSIAGTVDAQIVINGIAPAASGVKFIIPGVLLIHLSYQAAHLFFCHAAVHPHDPVHHLHTVP